MGAHSVVLDLLQIPYEKVWPVLLSFFNSVLLKTYHQVMKNFLPPQLFKRDP